MVGASVWAWSGRVEAWRWSDRVVYAGGWFGVACGPWGLCVSLRVRVARCRVCICWNWSAQGQGSGKRNSLVRAWFRMIAARAMEVHQSARKHGVPDADIRHAVDHPVASFDLGDDDSPRRRLVIGPDRAGSLLEVIVLMFDDDREMVIHAMKLRPRYEAMLEGDI